MIYTANRGRRMATVGEIATYREVDNAISLALASWLTWDDFFAMIHALKNTRLNDEKCAEILYTIGERLNLVGNLGLFINSLVTWWDVDEENEDEIEWGSYFLFQLYGWRDANYTQIIVFDATPEDASRRLSELIDNEMIEGLDYEDSYIEYEYWNEVSEQEARNSGLTILF